MCKWANAARDLAAAWKLPRLCVALQLVEVTSLFCSIRYSSLPLLAGIMSVDADRCAVQRISSPAKTVRL